MGAVDNGTRYGTPAATTLTLTGGEELDWLMGRSVTADPDRVMAEHERDRQAHHRC